MSAQTVAPDRETLRRLYHDEGLTQRQVAEALDISEGSAHKYIHEYGIETPEEGGRYTRDQCLDILRRFDRALPGRPSTSDVDAASDAPSRGLYARRFGSFGDALEAAGIDADGPTTAEVFHNQRRGADADARGSYRETLGEGHGSYLLAHPTAAHRLRRTSDPIAFADLDVPTERFYELVGKGILIRDDREMAATDDGQTYLRWTWTVADGVRTWIDSHVDPPGECPEPDCEAAGIRNLGDGRYTCSRDACDSEFGRATAKEVLGR